MTLADILKDSDYKQAQFDLFMIHKLKRKIIIKPDKNGKEVPYIQCAIRNREIKLTPEEVLYLDKFILFVKLEICE
jgi:type I restriction enzyme M protein